MKLPDKFKHIATQEQVDEWYDDAASNCCECMEEPSEEDIETWATFCVEERLETLAYWYEINQKDSK